MAFEKGSRRFARPGILAGGLFVFGLAVKYSEESTLNNGDGGDFVVVESGNGEPQQLLVHGEGRALLCAEQLDGPDRDS